MDEIEVTFRRSLKIWWSFAWRSYVLMVAVIVPLQILIFVFMLPHTPVTLNLPVTPQPSVIKPASPDMRHIFLIMALIWPVMMAAVVATQAQGMRWMLKKARWSDFRVAVLPLGNDVQRL